MVVNAMGKTYYRVELTIGKKYIPLTATAVVLVLLFTIASVRYTNFCTVRNISNLFYDNAFLGIAAIGMTFVILTGGIDLSVGSMIGFTTIFVASMIQHYGMPPAVAWPLALLLGTGFGFFMGVLIHVYKLPPFLVTLGGMFFARGMAFVVYMESVGIDHPLYSQMLDTIRIPLGPRASLSLAALVLIAMFIFAMYLAHFTRFGRNVYAVGGSEQSAVLMGLPVGKTIIMVYTFSGFCSALAGIVMTLYMGSGNPRSGFGLELDVIAAVVIGGTLLSGGVGYVFGTLLGVLILGTIRSALMFDGTLNSWWLRIAVGLLLLLFILLQRVIAARSEKK